MEVGRLDELIERLADGGRGVTVMPVRKGTRMGGFGTENVTPSTAGRSAISLPAEAVEAALVARRRRIGCCW